MARTLPHWLGLQSKTVTAVVMDILARLTRCAQEGCDLLRCCSLVSGLLILFKFFHCLYHFIQTPLSSLAF